MSETPEIRLKRLRLRAWRRGMRELDMLLGPFADARLAGLGPAGLDLFETLLAENDQDLLAWITGRAAPPLPLAPLVADLRTFASPA